MADARFRFRAAIVLELRRKRDQAAQDALRAANEALRRGEEAVDQARTAIAAACARPRDAEEDADWYRNWMTGLRMALAIRTEQLAGFRRSRNEALQAAVIARRALRVVERLRDRRLRAFEIEQARRERRDLDERAIGRYLETRRPSGGFL